MSCEGGFLHRSVFGGATIVNESIHCGTTSWAVFNGMNEELAGGMASESQLSLTGFAIIVFLRNQLPEL